MPVWEPELRTARRKLACVRILEVGVLKQMLTILVGAGCFEASACGKRNPSSCMSSIYNLPPRHCGEKQSLDKCFDDFCDGACRQRQALDQVA